MVCFAATCLLATGYINRPRHYGIALVTDVEPVAEPAVVELRVAVPPSPTLAVLKLIGLDQLLPVYPSLDEALVARVDVLVCAGFTRVILKVCDGRSYRYSTAARPRAQLK
jgi:hypothetical protein